MNSTAKPTNSTAKVPNSTANRMKSTARWLAKTCTLIDYLYGFCCNNGSGYVPTLCLMYPVILELYSRPSYATLWACLEYRTTESVNMSLQQWSNLITAVWVESYLYLLSSSYWTFFLSLCWHTWYYNGAGTIMVNWCMEIIMPRSSWIPIISKCLIICIQCNQLVSPALAMECQPKLFIILYCEWKLSKSPDCDFLFTMYLDLNYFIYFIKGTWKSL